MAFPGKHNPLGAPDYYVPWNEDPRVQAISAGVKRIWNNPEVQAFLKECLRKTPGIAFDVLVSLVKKKFGVS